MSDVALELAKKARKLISKENNWLQGTRRNFSRNGLEIGYCALGAIDEASRHDRTDANYANNYRLVVDTLAKHTYFENNEKDPYNPMWSDPCASNTFPEISGYKAGLKVANFNNLRTHKEVLKWFDKAIAELTADELVA